MSGVVAVVLAAGRSARMGLSKLTAQLWAKPVVAHAVDAALASRVSSVIVVTGDYDLDVRAALAGRRFEVVHNPEFAAGLATSLRTGIRAVGSDVHAAVVCLGDMPCVRAEHIDALIDAHEETGAICVASYDERRGNPVLWPERFFAELAGLAGDVGGRQLLEAHRSDVRLVPMPDDGVLIDVDTPEELAVLAAGQPR